MRQRDITRKREKQQQRQRQKETGDRRRQCLFSPTLRRREPRAHSLLWPIAAKAPEIVLLWWQLTPAETNNPSSCMHACMHPCKRAYICNCACMHTHATHGAAHAGRTHACRTHACRTHAQHTNQSQPQKKPHQFRSHDNAAEGDIYAP